MWRVSRDDWPEGFRSLVTSLSVGQIFAWAALYYGFSSIVLPMMAETGWSKALVMGANTLGLAVWGLATYAAGAAVDRGHARWMMSGGFALGAAGFALWAVATTPWMLYAAWVLLGAAGAATLYEPAFNVITRQFPTRYREGIAAVTMVGGLASTLSFPAVAGLIEGFGWRGALWCLAALLAGLLVPLHLWAMRGISHVVVTHPTDPEDAATLKQALHLPVFWLLTIAFTLYSIVMSAFWAHIMPLFAGKGLSAAQTLAIVIWVGPAQVMGRFAYAARGMSVSLRRLGIAVLAAVPVSMTLMSFTTDPVALTVWVCLYGVANGLVTNVRGGLVPAYFGRAHIGRIGGAMSGIGLVARAIGPLAVAWWLLWMPGYDGALRAMAVTGMLAVVALVAARKPDLSLGR